MRSVLCTLALLGVMLAGCADDSAAPAPTTATEEDSKVGTGAIRGLLVDDRFRPLAAGTVLLLETGQQATTDADGVFVFLDLEPGTYSLRASADGHEAAPGSVAVEEGVFADAKLLARRIIGTTGAIVSTEFNVFIPCGINIIVYGDGVDCTFDQSGETRRDFFDADYTEYGTNATWLVTEMKANQNGNYEIRVHPPEFTSCSNNHAIEELVGEDYVKIVNEAGVPREENHLTCGNAAWNNTDVVRTYLYVDGIGKAEGVGFGVGTYIGIKAKFHAHVLLGEPVVDPETFCTLCST